MKCEKQNNFLDNTEYLKFLAHSSKQNFLISYPFLVFHRYISRNFLSDSNLIL